MITSIDIIKEQIMIATGEKLHIRQHDVKCQGHAIECRINAEDHTRKFYALARGDQNLSCAGGPGIRVDSHAFSGYVISRIMIR